MPATSQHILEACGCAVDRYRDGSIIKAQAVLDIATQLVSVGDQQPGGANNGAPIHSYLAMLDEVDHQHQPGPRSGEEITGESKRVKVDAAKYAWAASDFLLENTLHPHIARTLKLIRIFGEDLTQARHDLSTSPSVPKFPEAEWTNVLAGRPMDLDHVFAGRYSPGSNKKVTERIGELDFSY
ncbi:hypothetical protein C2E23DRAFT_882416 [Lenzites betulinus]|nr:hypothetical protein C2E23DRAFT_882416 [Lenzites betulinus]